MTPLTTRAASALALLSMLACQSLDTYDTWESDSPFERVSPSAPRPPSLDVGVPARVLASNTRQEEPRCGDGVAEGNETCDDGNLVDGDGCDARCEVVDALPLGRTCPGQPLRVGERPTYVVASSEGAVAPQGAPLERCLADTGGAPAGFRVHYVEVTPALTGELTVRVGGAHARVLGVLESCASDALTYVCSAPDAEVPSRVRALRPVIVAVAIPADAAPGALWMRLQVAPRT